MTENEAISIVNPPPTHEQLVAEAEAKKQYLLSEAADAIAPLQDAVDLDMATPEEESALKEWKKYRVLLNRVDTSPGVGVVWPTPPASPAR
ncbi:TPA: tail fiber assembly protein [Vibrio vulnificus]|nr:tail fiber assembly protein [Vibrio vulnificus]